MRRLRIRERPDWKTLALDLGFVFHSAGDAPYWFESACYAFSLDQIETDIEQASGGLDAMCREVVGMAVRDEAFLQKLHVPRFAWDMIAESWTRDEPSLYGRFDLAYTGRGPVKLLEYNADTPTALFETGYFQWIWLEQALQQSILPPGCDQYNSLHDKLVVALGDIAGGRKLHLSCMTDSEEDLLTTSYLARCGAQAGLATEIIDIGDIGLNTNKRFVDLSGLPIELLFKLYPWEWLLSEQFGRALPRSSTQFLEPPWKIVMSSKGLLPLLWQAFPGHPNLLPSFFDDDPQCSSLGSGYVRKPVFSREGANVTMISGGEVIARQEGPYGAEGFIRQALAELPVMDNHFAVIGSWIVRGQPAGICIREDSGPITGNRSRFVPHIIVP